MAEEGNLEGLFVVLLKINVFYLIQIGCLITEKHNGKFKGLNIIHQTINNPCAYAVVISRSPKILRAVKPQKMKTVKHIARGILLIILAYQIVFLIIDYIKYGNNAKCFNVECFE